MTPSREQHKGVDGWLVGSWLSGFKLLNLAGFNTYEGAQSVKANLDNHKILDAIIKSCSNDTIA
jgi:hypothetical protein